MNEKKTPFFEFQEENLAHFTEFAGWKLPLHFGSAINEAQKVRYDIGFFDISHMGRIKITGADSINLFRKIFTRKLKDDSKGYYGFLVSEEGKVIDDAVIFRKTESDFIAIVNSSRKEKDLELFNYEIRKNNLKVQVEDISGSTFFVAIQGAKSFEKVKTFISILEQKGVVSGFSEAIKSIKRFSFIEKDNFFISRTGYTGEDGFEIYAQNHLAQVFWDTMKSIEIPPCGLAARDILRLEAGLILYGLDLTEEDTVFFSHIEKFVEPDFERYKLMQSIAEKNPTYLRGVVWDNFPIPSHKDETEPSGYVTSSVFSPILRRPISFVRFRSQVNEGDRVKVLTRGKANYGYVSKIPFVKK